MKTFASQVTARLGRARIAVAGLALAAIAFAVWSLEAQRGGLVIEEISAGTTPATVYRRANSVAAPAVIIAHGFAGSRQLMEAYSLTLAQAGYVAIAYDSEGHGRNPRPMSGDVAKVDGTTALLIAELGRVTEAALALPYVDGRVALLGHSMASDIIVRRALADERVAATVAISMFSRAVTPDRPRDLLVITGAWEGFLRDEALRALRLAEPSAVEGQTVGDAAAGTGRRAVVAPSVEHVGVLYSATALREARDWLDAAFGRTSTGPVAATGGAIVLLLAGIVGLAWPLARLLPATTVAARSPDRTTFLIAALAPAVLTPVVLAPFDTRFLPVLVADYLAVHLLVYGALALGVLAWRGVGVAWLGWGAGLALAAYGIIVFGGALDRYVAAFMPQAGRLPIILAIAVGAVPFMIADSLLNEAGRSRWWRMLIVRSAFLGSLGLAVALQFERLFFLLIILPVLVLFYATFGLMGGWAGRQTGSPLAVGLGLGLILAWSLGVTFPMFAAR